MDNIYDIEWMFHYKVYIAKSDIHGVGIRAINDIKKGEKIAAYTPKVSKKYPLGLPPSSNPYRYIERQKRINESANSFLSFFEIE